MKYEEARIILKNLEQRVRMTSLEKEALILAKEVLDRKAKNNSTG